MSAVARALRDAADLIDKRGWWDDQGDMPGEGGQVCALIALTAVCADSLTLHNARGALRRAVGVTVSRWNDGSNQAVVVATLRDVADVQERAS